MSSTFLPSFVVWAKEVPGLRLTDTIQTPLSSEGTKPVGVMLKR